MFHPSDRVLVAIMNNPRDFDIARDQGWYRIPTKFAPKSVTEAAVMAFYFTRAFGDEKWAIHWYAPVRGHELVHRSDLFADETDHPRADETYYKIQVGPLARLEQPIPSLRWRRITFIDTTWDRFTAAETTETADRSKELIDQLKALKPMLRDAASIRLSLLKALREISGAGFERMLDLIALSTRGIEDVDRIG